VDPSRIPEVSGLSGVELISSGERPDFADVMWGAMTPEAIACNDRRFSAAISERLGIALPNLAVLGSVQQLEECIASEGDSGRWVLKAPFSASGRLRLRRSGALDRAARTRAERLFALCGQLVFEPWVERIGDFGCAGRIHGDGTWELRPPHGQMTDGAGVFRGIDLSSDHLDDEERGVVIATAEHVAGELVAMGYRGPFGIDGYTYADPSGARALQPMSEINARLSFGHVAQAYAERLGATKRLWLCAEPIPEAAVALLLPSDADPTAAWIEAH
jgi:hypothetical protein